MTTEASTPTASTEVGSWQIDPTHSTAIFSVKHMMISTVRGSFGIVTGTINISESTPASSSVEATIDVTSISTRDDNRDNHLRSPDFFDVANHPSIHFKSSSVTHVSEDDYKVVGDLTIRGTTKEVTLDMIFEGTIVSPYGKQVAGFSATTSLNRKDFGLDFNMVLEAGGVMVGDKVKVELHIEAIKD